MPARPGVMPIHDWPLLKAVGAALLLYLPLSAFLLVIPPVLAGSAMALAAAQIVAGVVGISWGRWGSPRVSENIASFVFTTQFLTIGLRAWSAAASVSWVASGAVVGIYLLAWMLPSILPGVSAWLWREQVAPRTKLGRRLLGLSLTLLPTAGVLGAGTGLVLSRVGGPAAGWLVVAVLGIAVAVGWAQTTSHQLHTRVDGET